MLLDLNLAKLQPVPLTCKRLHARSPPYESDNGVGLILAADTYLSRMASRKPRPWMRVSNGVIVLSE